MILARNNINIFLTFYQKSWLTKSHATNTSQIHKRISFNRNCTFLAKKKKNREQNSIYPRRVACLWRVRNPIHIGQRPLKREWFLMSCRIVDRFNSLITQTLEARTTDHQALDFLSITEHQWRQKKNRWVNMYWILNVLFVYLFIFFFLCFVFVLYIKPAHTSQVTEAMKSKLKCSKLKSSIVLVFFCLFFVAWLRTLISVFVLYIVLDSLSVRVETHSSRNCNERHIHRVLLETVLFYRSERVRVNFKTKQNQQRCNVRNAWIEIECCRCCCCGITQTNTHCFRIYAISSTAHWYTHSRTE